MDCVTAGKGIFRSLLNICVGFICNKLASFLHSHSMKFESSRVLEEHLIA